MSLAKDNLERMKGFVQEKTRELYKQTTLPNKTIAHNHSPSGQKHLKRKLEAIDIHVRQRVDERYGETGFVINPQVTKELILGLAGNSNKFVVIFRTKESNRRSDIAGIFDNKHKVRFVYDKELKSIVTFLPLNDYEKYLDNYMKSGSIKEPKSIKV